MRVPLRYRIFVGQAANLTLVLLVWTGGFYSIARLSRSAESILSENYRSIAAANGMLTALREQDASELRLLLGEREQSGRSFALAQNRFAQWLALEHDNITIPGEERAALAVESLYTEYLAGHVELILAESRSPYEARAVYAARSESLQPEIEYWLDELVRMNRDEMYAASQRTRTAGRRALIITLVVGVLALAAGVWLSAWLSRRISAPVRRLTDLAHEIAEGNLDVYIKPGSSDEIGQLASEFDRMVKRLKEYRDMDVERIVAERTRADAVLASIEDGIVTFDSEFRVVSANEAAARAIGRRHGEIVGRHILEVVRDERLFRRLKEAFESGGSPQVEEDEILLERDEQRLHYRYAVTPIRTGEGRNLGVVLLLQNISKFRELDRLKTEFIMTASHELKTPLTSLSMAVHLLEETGLTERQQELVGMARAESDRLKSTVLELLDLSRIESGRIEMRMEPVDIGVLCKRALKETELIFSGKGLNVAADLPDEVPVVAADADKILLVLTNLLSNAAKYSREKGDVRLAVQHVRDVVFVSVRDDGPGIPFEAQGRVFEPFYRVPGTEQTGGSGLGLAIAREIVRAHRGTIWVESEPGRGSRFVFSLPAAGREV